MVVGTERRKQSIGSKEEGETKRRRSRKMFERRESGVVGTKSLRNE
jgi:hypothetical protein